MAQSIMETEFPQCALYKLKMRNVHDVIHSQCEGLRSREANGLNPSLRTGEGDIRCLN